jgi:hypothetical protein
LRPAALADDYERALGVREQLAEAIEVLGTRRRVCHSNRIRVGDVGLLGEDVLGKRKHDRPRPA